MLEAVCAKCGTTFQTPNKPKVLGKRYCSRSCWYGRNDLRPREEFSVLLSLNCTTCGKSFRRPRKLVRYNNTYCSRACYFKTNQGAAHSSWRGGRYKLGIGYWNINTGPGQNRREHILIAERALGRSLRPREVVHHIDMDKTNNASSNLLICTQSYHAWLHQEMARRYALEHFGKKVS